MRDKALRFVFGLYLVLLATTLVRAAIDRVPTNTSSGQSMPASSAPVFFTIEGTP